MPAWGQDAHVTGGAVHREQGIAQLRQAEVLHQSYLAIDQGLHECLAIDRVICGDGFFGLGNPVAQQLRLEGFQRSVVISRHQHRNWLAVVVDLDRSLLDFYSMSPNSVLALFAAIVLMAPLPGESFDSLPL